MKREMRLMLIAVFCFILGPVTAHAGPPAEVLEVEAQRIKVIEQARAATVCIFAAGGGGGGSGVIISPDGYCLTNHHVTAGAGKGPKCGLSQDGVLYDSVIVSADPTGDVALIKLLGRDDFPHAKLGDSDALQQGDWCFASGNPFLLANDFRATISYGLVSGVHRYQYPSGTLLEYADCIQMDAAINPGNSGGPLFNMQGELVGINGRGSFEKRGRVNVGVGYAISINQIKHFMGVLKSGRVVDHATLGAVVGSDEDGRVVITDVLENSDAYRRGLRYGDEVVSFGGREIRTVNAFKNVLGIYPRNWRVPLTYRRDGKMYNTLVRLRGVNKMETLDQMFNGPATPATPKPKQDEKPADDKDGKDKGDNSKGKKDEPKGEDKGKDAKPSTPASRPQAGGLPPEVAKRYEARRGYVNYYFNRQNQQRVWKAVASHGDFSSAGKHWIVKGSLDNGEAVKVDLAEDVGSIILPVGESKAAFSDDLTSSLNPPGSGGLLAALHIWQRFLSLGLNQFGEVYYWGAMPVPTQEGNVDILIGIYGGVETKFFFHPTTGYLIGMEMAADEDADPAEIYFSDYRKVDGREVPFRWEVRHGDSTFAIINVDEFNIAAPVEK